MHRKNIFIYMNNHSILFSLFLHYIVPRGKKSHSCVEALNSKQSLSKNESLFILIKLVPHWLGSTHKTTSHTRNKWNRIHDFGKLTVTSVQSQMFQRGVVTLSSPLQKLSGLWGFIAAKWQEAEVWAVGWDCPDPYSLEAAVVSDAYNLGASLDHMVHTASSTITTFRFCPTPQHSLGMSFSFGYWKMKLPKAESMPYGRKA